MSEEWNRNTLERYVQALARQDLDTIEDHLHDDYVEEYPQSSERIRGKHNWRTAELSWPA
jgi:ketosteroid isomerase-like protein